MKHITKLKSSNFLTGSDRLSNYGSICNERLGKFQSDRSVGRSVFPERATSVPSQPALNVIVGESIPSSVDTQYETATQRLLTCRHNGCLKSFIQTITETM